MSHSVKNIFRTSVRIVLYAVIVTLVAELMYYDAFFALKEHKFSEESLTEYAQSIMLLAVSAVFLYTAFSSRKYSSLSFLLFSFAFASFIREQDLYLDEWLYHGSWKMGSFGILIWAGYLAFRQGKALLINMENFFSSFSFGLMVNAVLTTYIFSRLLGRKIFWMAVMEDAYFRDVKNASEECVELFGYTMLFIAGIEYFFFVKRQINISSLVKVERELFPQNDMSRTG